MEIQNTNSSESGLCSSSNKLISYIFSAFVVGAVVGVLVDPYLPASLSGSNKSYQAGFDNAKSLVENSSLGAAFKTPNEIKQLSGSVTAINGSQLTLKVKSTNPFDDPSLANRTVLLNTSTKVVSLTAKPSATYQAEVDSFIKAQSNTATTSATKSLPSAFVSSPVNITNIAIGDSINVLTSQNIKTLKEFTATEVQILPNNIAK